jgi:hypothetical protein
MGADTLSVALHGLILAVLAWLTRELRRKK